MALEERKCPNCGSTHLIQKDELIICQNCEATYKDKNHFKVTNVHIIRDEAKIAKIKAKEKEDAQDKKVAKIALFVMAGIILLCLVIALATGAFEPTIHAPTDASHDYQFSSITVEQVEKAFMDAGFENIETLPVYDVTGKSIDCINRISKVTVAGEEEWYTGLLIRSKKSYKKDVPVKIYYRLLDPESKIYAPEWDTGAYRGQKYQTVQKALADACFSNIRLYPLQDLDAADNENNEKVEKVTIEGETDWSTGLFGTKNEYEQNSEVIIYYHSVKQ